MLFIIRSKYFPDSYYGRGVRGEKYRNTASKFSQIPKLHCYKWEKVDVVNTTNPPFIRHQSQLSHFLFLWIDRFLDWMKNTLLFMQYKHSGTFANRRYEELSYPQKAENVRPHSSNSLKMRPHYSQSSRENATPSSGTFPLASCKEVPPPPGPPCYVG